MKRKSITIALALLLVAGMAFAGMQEKGKGMQEHKMKGENYQLLTDDQKDKVADAKRDFEKKAIPLRADIKVLMIEIDEMVAEGKSTKEINTTLNKLNDAKAKLAEEKLTHQIEVRKIVGEENYKKMQMHKMYKMKKGEHGKKMGGKMMQNEPWQKRECKK